MKEVLQRADYGVLVLDRRFRSNLINRSFVDTWRLPKRKADALPSFAELVRHGADTKAYAIPESCLDKYIADRLNMIYRGDIPTFDIRMDGAKVLRLHCTILPDGGRMLTYHDVSDLVAAADRLQKKLAEVLDAPRPVTSAAAGGEDKSIASVAPWQVRRAEEFIAANWQHKISADDIAAAAGTSLRSLFRTFEQCRGYSPMEFVRASRLRHAERMLNLSGPETTVSEVAAQCGFSDIGQFSKAYRRHYGVAPSQVLYRTKSVGG